MVGNPNRARRNRAAPGARTIYEEIFRITGAGPDSTFRVVWSEVLFSAALQTGTVLVLVVDVQFAVS